MQIKNLSTVDVDDATGGLILTAEEAADGFGIGMTYVVVNPSVDIVLVDPLGAEAAVPGTVANSPWVCPAGVPTEISHRSGALRALSTSGTATVKRGLGGEP